MGLIKRLLIVILSLLVLSSPVSAELCSVLEFFSPQMCQNKYMNGTDHSSHEKSSCTNKIPCSDNHSCCSLATGNTISYLLILDSYYLNPAEISLKPSEIAKSFYRPPRTHLL